MSKIESYPPGVFCWADLMTADTAAAKHFYGEMFGWSSVDIPAPDGAYTLFQLGGDDVAGMLPARPGMPNCWNVHFSVTSADEMAAKVVAGGGKILNGPFDAMDAGRMAVAQDPQGAVFCVWQARKHPGATYAGALGRVVWPELATTDAGGAAKFYKGLFGWGTKPETGVESAPYTEWLPAPPLAGHAIAGMIPMNGPQWAGIPPHWNCYVTVANCDQSAAKATQLGATLYVQPTDVPNVGRFAVVADPQRAVICIIQMNATN
ncbi:MAG: Glyoxalase/bleomycin resistance protein/dioxygenase [Candidatus Solibacter sp.]|nr:Glyoxalase/bleomycin resistance protein/dioxygenase [Candidatus Solibacter sp.]